jgi:Uma2 family endonuclease
VTLKKNRDGGQNEAMSAPLVKPHVTYRDLCEIQTDQRWELIDGEAYLAPAPNLRHQDVLQRLLRRFEDAIADRSKVYLSPVDVVLSDDTALQPDLVFVREENRGILGDHVTGPPDLVAEVLSPSTRKMDRELKMEAYARFGIPEYWIVDPFAETIEIHRLEGPGTTSYSRIATCHAGDPATTPLLPSLAVDPADLFHDA